MPIYRYYCLDCHDEDLYNLPMGSKLDKCSKCKSKNIKQGYNGKAISYSDDKTPGERIDRELDLMREESKDLVQTLGTREFKP